jgi:hypothetical protein
MSSQSFQPPLAFQHSNAFGARHQPKVSLVEHLLSVAIFRCWHLVLFFGLWTTVWVYIDMTSDSVNFHMPDGLLMLYVSLQ